MSAEKTARLDQLLASLGYGSRREVKALIQARRVTVDGTVVRDSGRKVHAAQVRVDGAVLEDVGPLCILLHKPCGYVCSHDCGEGPRVYDLLPPRWMARNPLPMSVGRLDKDTTGALLITDQRALVHRLTAPRNKVPKVYIAELDQAVRTEWIDTFAAGTLLLDGETKPCAPAQLEVIAASRVRLTLTEGRYHQVKRMFAALGATVVQLHREQFGPFSADHLAAGQWQAIEWPESPDKTN